MRDRERKIVGVAAAAKVIRMPVATVSGRAVMHSFPLPVPAPEVTISLLWHPRMDADPAHRWLRGLVLTICGAP